VNTAPDPRPRYEQALLGITSHYPLAIRTATSHGAEVDDCYGGDQWVSRLPNDEEVVGYNGSVYRRQGSGPFVRVGPADLDPAASLRRELLEALNENGTNFDYGQDSVRLYVMDLDGHGPANVSLRISGGLLVGATVSPAQDPRTATAFTVAYRVTLPPFTYREELQQ